MGERGERDREREHKINLPSTGAAGKGTGTPVENAGIINNSLTCHIMPAP